MLGAPPGFIPLRDGVIVNVRQIIAVVEEPMEELDPDNEARYKAEVAAYIAWTKKADPASARPLRPYYHVVMRKTGELTVLVRWQAGAALVRHCSLVQFIAKMQIALEESACSCKC